MHAVNRLMDSPQTQVDNGCCADCPQSPDHDLWTGTVDGDPDCGLFTPTATFCQRPFLTLRGAWKGRRISVGKHWPRSWRVAMTPCFIHTCGRFYPY